MSVGNATGKQSSVPTVQFRGLEGPSLLARVDSLEDDKVLHLLSIVLDPRPTLGLARGDPRLRSDVEGF